MTELAAALAAHLPAFLARQRWFPAKGRPLRSVAVTTEIPLCSWGEPYVDLVLADVEFDDGSPAQTYQLLVGRRSEIGDELEHVVIGRFDGWIARYLSTASAEREALIPEGLELAKVRRTALAELIPTDPKQALERAVPDDQPFEHAEGNSPAHVMSTLVGSSVLVAVEDERLALGRWQSIFFCEFDGPRSREVWLRKLG